MKRELLRSTTFVRAARQMAMMSPGAADDLSATFELLTEDAFHHMLRTHQRAGSMTRAKEVPIEKNKSTVRKSEHR